MTFVPIHPEVGIVFKKKDGTTFTQWYSSTENNENNWQTVNEWIADALILNRLHALPEDRTFFNREYCNVPGDIMAIVKMK